MMQRNIDVQEVQEGLDQDQDDLERGRVYHVSG